ncbi:lipoyltransferase 2, mitochondrial [Seminavis robusta]|uniref:lipoyl(octanoyl) transferase n=1 Tax=Seminavis robusta TaxID=568900 RepID=A0A9N8EAB6_9STRA|nr:lipoyltransferase 2, mitochondrial [Seminavis robusta]|eukprot:Sro720_g192630.1 lipoyltransferase 2, mitochondrial (328) ;mRNA; r:31869-33141
MHPLLCQVLILCWALETSTGFLLDRNAAATSTTRTGYTTACTSLALAPQQLGSFETLELSSTTISPSDRRVVLEDLVSADANNRVQFEESWDWQKHLLQEHADRIVNTPEVGPFLTTQDNGKNNEVGSSSLTSGGLDTIFMLEHEAVYTLGTGSDEKFILGTNPNVPTIRMDRGGEVTYHGPGQLVVYPVLDLRYYKQDIHWYMRALEECILVALHKCGLETAERQDDTTGIWIDNHKVAAIGVKCRKWITMHGLAVNVETTALENFQGIVPCGLEGRQVGCVNQFLEQQGKPSITVREFAPYMKEALADVFQIQFETRIRDTLPTK